MLNYIRKWQVVIFDSPCTNGDINEVNIHVAGWERNRFKEVRIRICQICWNSVVIGIVVVVSTQSLGLVHVFVVNTDSDRQMAAEGIKYSAVCLHNHCSAWWHFYLHIHGPTSMIDIITKNCREQHDDNDEKTTRAITIILSSEALPCLV